MLLSRSQRKHSMALSASFHLGRPWLASNLPRLWWLVFLRAIAATAFGVTTLVWPRHSALALVTLFGVYALIDGCCALLISARNRGARQHWWLKAAAATSIAAGLFAFAQPRRMALTLIIVMGLWLVVRGITEVLGQTSIADPRAPTPAHRWRWSVFFNGAMSAIFGLCLVAAPRIGALGLMWGVGMWAIMHGLLMLPLALKLRRSAAEPLAGPEDGALAPEDR